MHLTWLLLMFCASTFYCKMLLGVMQTEDAVYPCLGISNDRDEWVIFHARNSDFLPLEYELPLDPIPSRLFWGDKAPVDARWLVQTPHRRPCLPDHDRVLETIYLDTPTKNYRVGVHKIGKVTRNKVDSADFDVKMYMFYYFAVLENPNGLIEPSIRPII
jgi:hypothetical protein